MSSWKITADTAATAAGWPASSRLPDMDNCGTLPDFGNFCMQRTAEGCAEEYDRYRGVEGNDALR